MPTKKNIYILIFLLIIDLLILTLLIQSIILNSSKASQLIQTFGITLGLTGFYQVANSDFFGMILNKLQRADGISSSLPSHLVRQVIDNPDRPLRTKLRNLIFFEPKTGFYLIVLSFFVEILGIWWNDIVNQGFFTHWASVNYFVIS